MPKGYKSIKKYCGGQWLSSHFGWLRSGDYFKIEDSDDILFATSDPYYDEFRGLSVKTIGVDKVPDESEVDNGGDLLPLPKSPGGVEKPTV